MKLKLLLLPLAFLTLMSCAFDSPEVRDAASRIGQAAIDAAAQEAITAYQRSLAENEPSTEGQGSK